MNTWADNRPDIEPDPKMEPFFVLVALELGDPDTRYPDGRGWMETNAVKFHEMYSDYTGTVRGNKDFQSPRHLLQYIIWYDREKSRKDYGKCLPA